MPLKPSTYGRNRVTCSIYPFQALNHNIVLLVRHQCHNSAYHYPQSPVAVAMDRRALYRLGVSKQRFAGTHHHDFVFTENRFYAYGQAFLFRHL